MYNLRNRSFLKEIDFSEGEMDYLLTLSKSLKHAKYAGTEVPRLHGKDDRGNAVVARAMPVAIVVGLEVVDIEEQHGQGRVVPASALPLGGEHDVEVTAVVQAGERVDDGQRMQFVLQAPVLLQLLPQARIEVIEATRDPRDHGQDDEAERKHPQQPAPVPSAAGVDRAVR